MVQKLAERTDWTRVEKKVATMVEMMVEKLVERKVEMSAKKTDATMAAQLGNRTVEQ